MSQGIGCFRDSEKEIEVQLEMDLEATPEARKPRHRRHIVPIVHGTFTYGS